MKIERINDKQFRCILSDADLLRHHLTLKKFASGGEDAQQLFREMMERSYEELGFEANELPLLIEARSMKEGELTITVSKVDSFEELPAHVQEELFLKSMRNLIHEVSKGIAEDKRAQEPASPVAVFAYPDDAPFELPSDVTEDPKGICSTLYHAPKNKLYYLVFSVTRSKDPETTRRMFQLVNRFSDYARQLGNVTPASRAYYEEHYTKVIARNAIRGMRDMHPEAKND